MRYELSVERSAELLREALPWMSRQSAALHPVSYAVWFDYVAQTNPALSAAIDEHLAREGHLDEFATHALFMRHIAEVDPETAQRMVDSLQRVLAGIGDAAGSAGTHAARFGATLSQLAAALERCDTAAGMGSAEPRQGAARNGPAPRQLADVVAEVIADTGAMRSQIGGLQQRLADSRREIEHLREQVRRARAEPMLDTLTGLSNRRAFDQALAAALTASEPAPSAAPGAAPRGPWLLISDIDHFRRIKGAYGAAFGDQVLQAVAAALRGLAPSASTLGRVGDEAFALLAPDLDRAAALALAERLRGHIGAARIRRPGQGGAEAVTLSLGLAAHRPGEAARALMERAQDALRRARSDGRNRSVSAA